ncbi:MAG: YkgJ family cysteine cluster protein [Myxococcales bacterium]|nr:YkgJ family cysteine cluster protein [Myxococcales bacterium]
MNQCTKCGACCVAPDISSLGKPLGIRCTHLTDDNLCGIYERRPRICRDYAADWLCERIAAPSLDERVWKYLQVFGLESASPVQPGEAASTNLSRDKFTARAGTGADPGGRLVHLGVPAR